MRDIRGAGDRLPLEQDYLAQKLEVRRNTITLNLSGMAGAVYLSSWQIVDTSPAKCKSILANAKGSSTENDDRVGELRYYTQRGHLNCKVAKEVSEQVFS